MPEKLTELHLMFAIEAVKYNVFPLDDRMVERIDPAVSGRPALVKGQSQLFYPGTGRLPEAAVVNVKNASFSVTAEVTLADDKAAGVVIAQGGRFGGWTLYAKDGRANFAYNYFGLEIFRTEAEAPIAAGRHQIRAEFAYDGGGVGKGGTVTLYYDGKGVGSGRILHTQPLAFSAEETTDVGHESGSLVTADYAEHNAFTGRIHWVQVDVGKDNFSHLIKAEDRLRVVMTRQ
jgi:arylsulfatase